MSKIVATYTDSQVFNTCEPKKISFKDRSIIEELSIT
jgi:hypothetical protein